MLIGFDGDLVVVKICKVMLILGILFCLVSLVVLWEMFVDMLWSYMVWFKVM